MGGRKKAIFPLPQSIRDTKWNRIHYNALQVASRFFLPTPVSSIDELSTAFLAKKWCFVNLEEDDRYELNPPVFRRGAFHSKQAAFVFTKGGVEIVDNEGISGIQILPPRTLGITVIGGYWSNIPDTADDYFLRLMYAQIGRTREQEADVQSVAEWKKNQDDSIKEQLAKLQKKSNRIKTLKGEDEDENANT